MNHSFHSRWRRELGEFIAFRRTYFTSVWPAQQLRRFDVRRATPALAIAQWLKCGPHRHPITRSNDLTAIRQFCLYRRRFDPDGFVPDRIEPVSAVRRRFQACILRPEQVQLLLRNIRTLQGPPLRLARLRALFLVQNPHRNTNERCEGAPGGDDSLGLFWDGTRRWPYVIDDLARGLALTAVFAALVGKSEAHSNYPDVAISLAEECLGDECVEVEIGMSDGSYTRGLAWSSELQKAIRSDFSIWLKRPGGLRLLLSVT